MRRISKQTKSMRGFSLVEMLIVIGIIIILAGALALGVNDVLNPAKKARNSVSIRAAQESQSIHQSEQKLANYGF